jgi:hypothetical protein
VTCLELVSGHPVMISTTTQSIGLWRFRPYFADGKKKEFYGRIKYEAIERGLTYQVIQRRQFSLRPGAGGLADFAAKVGGEDFHRAAHFVEAGTHAGADAIGERVFFDYVDALAVWQARRGFAGS